jgi:membrane protease subunit HflC
MSSRVIGTIIVLAVVLLVVITSLFTVSETEYAIRTQFGAIVGSGYAPGLHPKMPWDQIVKIDRRVLNQSFTGETFLTNDNRGLIVDFYIKWRVHDATRYYQATGANETTAGDRVSDIVKDGIKSVVAQRTLEQIVTAERASVTSQMFAGSSQAVGGLGIELIDVRVQSIDLPDDVALRVYEKMKQNFAKIANRLRAEGASSAMSIKAAADRQRTEIVAQAERDALRVQGAADAQATDTYARAYAANPEFYAFYRSLQAYEHSLGKDGDVFVLAPESEFFKYMKDPGKAPHH